MSRRKSNPSSFSIAQCLALALTLGGAGECAATIAVDSADLRTEFEAVAAVVVEVVGPEPELARTHTAVAG